MKGTNDDTLFQPFKFLLLFVFDRHKIQESSKPQRFLFVIVFFQRGFDKHYKAILASMSLFICYSTFS